MILVSALFALLTAQPLVFVAEVKVSAPVLKLGDVTNIDVLPIPVRRDAKQLILMRLPETRATVTLQVNDLAARVRSLMPRLAP
jgi:hypothetical protein